MSTSEKTPGIPLIIDLMFEPLAGLSESEEARIHFVEVLFQNILNAIRKVCKPNHELLTGTDRLREAFYWFVESIKDPHGKAVAATEKEGP